MASAGMRAGLAYSEKLNRTSSLVVCNRNQPLRGKAMAGARGDASARIFTTQLDAELLAIAGIYRVVEDKLPESVHNRPAQVRLDNDRLCLDPLQN